MKQKQQQDAHLDAHQHSVAVEEAAWLETFLRGSQRWITRLHRQTPRRDSVPVAPAASWSQEKVKTLAVGQTQLTQSLGTMETLQVRMTSKCKTMATPLELRIAVSNYLQEPGTMTMAQTPWIN